MCRIHCLPFTALFNIKSPFPTLISESPTVSRAWATIRDCLRGKREIAELLKSQRCLYRPSFEKIFPKNILYPVLLYYAFSLYHPEVMFKYFPEMIAINRKSYCQRKEPGPSEKGPKEEFPVIEPLLPD